MTPHGNCIIIVWSGNEVHLFKVDGNVKTATLESLVNSLSLILSFEFKIAEDHEYPLYAFEPRRNQYYAKKIIERLGQAQPEDCEKMLCVTDVDICTPVLTFVYGEAQLNGSVAVVSFYRLRQEFFSLPANRELLEDRLTKECIHELGHCYGLVHCSDARCVMFFSNNILNVDNKQNDFCANCKIFFGTKARKERND